VFDRAYQGDTRRSLTFANRKEQMAGYCASVIYLTTKSELLRVFIRQMGDGEPPASMRVSQLCVIKSSIATNNLQFHDILHRPYRSSLRQVTQRGEWIRRFITADPREKYIMPRKKLPQCRRIVPLRHLADFNPSCEFESPSHKVQSSSERDISNIITNGGSEFAQSDWLQGVGGSEESEITDISLMKKWTRLRVHRRFQDVCIVIFDWNTWLLNNISVCLREVQGLL